MTPMQELIERLEKAEHGSFELNKAILSALGYTWRGMAYWNDEIKSRWRGSAAPSNSIDGALTLLPAGMEWSISTLYGFASVEIGLNDNTGNGPWVASREDANVPLALCVASLRARLALASDGEKE